MKVLQDKNLANYTTMRIGGFASEIIEAETEQDVIDIVLKAKNENRKLITLGKGSNIIFKDGYDGIILLNRLSGLVCNGIRIIAKSGANWDDVVKLAVENNLAGIESLSAIPGTAGAAPVNNIGAYGQEIKDTLEKVRAYDRKKNKYIDISNTDCQFAYRDSIFKSKEHCRFIITEITLKLKPYGNDYLPPDYEAVRKGLLERCIAKPKLTDVRNLIIDIRKNKLPDPAWLANTGSYFKNPIVDDESVNHLLETYPEMPHYPYKTGQKKLAAGWLIDQAGLKNCLKNGFRVYDKQALVIVNESGSCYKELCGLTDYVCSTVKQKYGIQLEPEPEII